MVLDWNKYPSFIGYLQVSNNSFFPSIHINDQGTIQFQTFNGYSRTTNDQSGSRTNLDFFRIRELKSKFGRATGKVWLQHNGWTRNHRDTIVCDRFRLFDLTANSLHHDSSGSILIRFSSSSRGSGNALGLESDTIWYGILDGRKAQFSGELGVSHLFLFSRLQDGGKILHHAFETGGLSKGSFGFIRIFGIDKLGHLTLATLKSLVVSL
mmetsp:Transcript_113073/g.325019  ORF Transcript_113073/g.325019 Transcript_113073/m.325019 type:complete len:210 (-) Transcript_113073:45-674(-)